MLKREGYAKCTCTSKMHPDSKLSSYVLFMGASLPPFLLLCSRKICTRFCLFVTRTLLSFGDTSQYNVLDRFHDFHITLSLNNVERTSLEISFQTGNKKPFSLSQNIRKLSCLNLDDCVAHIVVSLNALALYKSINLSGKTAKCC